MHPSSEGILCPLLKVRVSEVFVNRFLGADKSEMTLNDQWLHIYTHRETHLCIMQVCFRTIVCNVKEIQSPFGYYLYK